jgi:hypothetical protein
MPPRAGVATITAMQNRVIPRLAVVALAVSALASIVADQAGAAAPQRKTQIAQSGSGTWEDFPCFAPRTGRCQFTLKGAMSGTPVADATYYIAIDDQGAATPDGCVNAHVAGLFGDRVPDQNIGFVGDGQLCPDGAGGHRFESPFRITGGGGRFSRISGSGSFSATLGSDHSATVTVTGTARGIR